VAKVVESGMLRCSACRGDVCGARGGAPTCDAWCLVSDAIFVIVREEKN
jgi:hypothetical protein